MKCFIIKLAMKRILSKKMPLAYVFGLFVVVVAATVGITLLLDNTKESTTTISAQNCAVKIKRLDGYQLVKPIMFADEECPSESLSTLNQSISSIIGAYQQAQTVTAASVYFRDFDTAQWTIVNETEEYESGSLFKVPVMITFLKMDEENPGVLNKKITYSKPFSLAKEVNFTSKHIELGKQYTVRELLKYMIVYSDNNATSLLIANIDQNIIRKLFEDLGMPKPNFYAPKFYFNVQGFSLFMRTIYNASYLSVENSEFAAQLLSESDFKDGLLKGIPNGTPMAHKFGEAGDQNQVQLHESAIIYLDNKAYLLTVMTKGKDMKTLSKLLADISKAVYDTQKSEPLSSL